MPAGSIFLELPGPYMVRSLRNGKKKKVFKKKDPFCAAYPKVA